MQTLKCQDHMILQLMAALGMPPLTKRFAIHADADSERVLVECEYYPFKGAEFTTSRRFKLVELQGNAEAHAAHNRAVYERLQLPRVV